MARVVAALYPCAAAGPPRPGGARRGAPPVPPQASARPAGGSAPPDLSPTGTACASRRPASGRRQLRLPGVAAAPGPPVAERAPRGEAAGDATLVLGPDAPARPRAAILCRVPLCGPAARAGASRGAASSQPLPREAPRGGGRWEEGAVCRGRVGLVVTGWAAAPWLPPWAAVRGLCPPGVGEGGRAPHTPPVTLCRLSPISPGSLRSDSSGWVYLGCGSMSR